MRISTKSMYDTATNQLGNLQTALARTQQQLSTNRQNLTPSDDPIATARALQVTQSQAINTQMGTNRQGAESSLTSEEQALASTAALIQNVQTLAVSAGNGALNDSDRAGLATQLDGQLSDLMGLANTTDATGNYVFSGYQSSTPAFAQTAAGVSYLGDQGQRQLQVAAGRQMAVSDPGSTVFQNIATGNGSFTTAAAAGNAARGGSGTVSAGSVTDASKLTGDKYTITFSGAGPSASYTVTDDTLGQPVPVPVPPAVVVPTAYVSGQQIAFDGMQFNVQGSPADGDQFSLAPSSKQSLFTTLSNLINVLRTPATGAAGQAALTNGLSDAQLNLSSALNNVATVQTSVGTRLNQLDTLDTAGDDLNLQYTTTLSGLQDLDTVAAISNFTQQQATLDAAQKSFKAISSLSLFNYIN